MDDEQEPVVMAAPTEVPFPPPEIGSVGTFNLAAFLGGNE